MRRFGSALVLGVLAVAGGARAATWQLDPAHTSIGFAVRHLMVSTVRGRFSKVSGVVQVDEADPSKSRIEATIDASSIDTGNEKRDAHLRNADFLDVAKYPTITFRSTGAEKTATGWKMTGDLTLHGVTRPVVLDVEGPTEPIQDSWGNTRAGAAATTTINRRDFGITWNKLLEAGGVTVGDEVRITIDVEATRTAP
jgi:polyisoprenoid-binding protein YceI